MQSPSSNTAPGNAGAGRASADLDLDEIIRALGQARSDHRGYVAAQCYGVDWEHIDRLREAEAVINECRRLRSQRDAVADALRIAKGCLKHNRGPSMDEFRAIQDALASLEQEGGAK